MKTKRFKAKIANQLIRLGATILSFIWSKAYERRAAAQELIVRTAYTVEESVCHYLETIGLDKTGQIRETLELARSQGTNDQRHEDVFGRDLNAPITGEIGFLHGILPYLFIGSS